ncbi:hypothetical protein MSAN_00644300 [Mycena sanguinolenta]|uniref:Uncharacterized protein n=1 Tax=Mycena sanguinolenta TaxID=230812 RepID=A0A8H6YZZ0_9AGAR|nr:hypothetical protein MSAN_00644300 [Mycena sanguinolenta]
MRPALSSTSLLQFEPSAHDRLDPPTTILQPSTKGTSMPILILLPHNQHARPHYGTYLYAGGVMHITGGGVMLSCVCLVRTRTQSPYPPRSPQPHLRPSTLAASHA